MQGVRDKERGRPRQGKLKQSFSHSSKKFLAFRPIVTPLSLTLEVANVLEVVLLHEGLQPAAQLLDHGVAMKHHTGAHLQAIQLRLKWDPWP